MHKLALAALAVAASSEGVTYARPGSAAFLFSCAIGPRIHHAPPDMAVMEAALTSAITDLGVKTKAVETIAEKYEKALTDRGTVDRDLKDAADKALTEMNGIKTQLQDFEQKFARVRSVVGEGVEHKSAGQIFADSEFIKTYIDDPGKALHFKGRADVEVKAITSLSAPQNATGSALVRPTVLPGMVMIPDRPLMIRDLISPGRTNSNLIEYAKENVPTLNAASVAENPSAIKPQSELTFTLANAPVRTFAHFMIASKQILADAPQLQSIIDYRLRYGLAVVEDTQLLLGSGTGTDILGMMPQAVAYAAPAGVTIAAETRVDRLRLAMLQATVALFPATGHILNPTDWALIELAKDTQGRYLWGNPAGLMSPTLWGLPVAVSFAMPVNNFLTGAFRYACQIFDREDANIAVSTEDRDNFVKNMVTILAEQRLALVVSRPQALIKGTFTGVAGGPV